MKKVLLTFGIALFGFTAVLAQDMGQQEDVQNQDPQDQTEMGAPSDVDQSGREQIEEADLPAAVTDALSTGAYADMTVSEVYKVKEQATDETGISAESKAYEVHLLSEDGQSTVVKFNEEGQIEESQESQY